jgi:hypothetical protein
MDKTSLPRVRAWFSGAWAILSDKLRASPLLLVFLIAFAVTVWMNPAKVGLTIWGIAKLGMSGYVGYWIDRLVFP